MDTIEQRAWFSMEETERTETWPFAMKLIAWIIARDSCEQHADGAWEWLEENTDQNDDQSLTRPRWP